MKIKWIIQNTKDIELFWNNDYGWGDREGAQKFPEDSPQRLNLPIDGKWVIVTEKK